jgi:hypothetical protein
VIGVSWVNFSNSISNIASMNAAVTGIWPTENVAMIARIGCTFAAREKTAAQMIIDSRLYRIVAAQSYPLLFATISGAHLYGIPLPDSDFDLRGAHVLPHDRVIDLEVGDEAAEDSHVVNVLVKPAGPHQRERRSGSLNAAKTCSTVAGISRHSLNALLGVLSSFWCGGLME